MQTLQHWVLLWCLFQRTWKPKTYWGINYWETLLISNNISRNISLFDKDLVRCVFADPYLNWQYHWALTHCQRIDTVVTYFVWIPQRLAGGGQRPPTVRSQHTWSPQGRAARRPKAALLRVLLVHHQVVLKWIFFKHCLLTSNGEAEIHCTDKKDKQFTK